MHPTMQPQGPTTAAPNPAMVPGVISGVCALLLAITLFSHAWASAREGGTQIGAGMMSIEGCETYGGRCESLEWDKAVKVLDIPSDVNTFRTIGLITGLAAAGVLAAVALLCLTRSPHKVPFALFQSVLAAAAFATTWFATRLWMSDDDVNFGPAWGSILGIASVVVGGVVLRTMVKSAAAKMGAAQPVAAAQQPYAQQGYPPQQPAYQPPVAAAPAVCPRCGGPLEYVAQYQRYFCRRENQYV